MIAMRLVDMMLSIPAVLLAVLTVAVLVGRFSQSEGVHGSHWPPLLWPRSMSRSYQIG